MKVAKQGLCFVQKGGAVVTQLVGTQAQRVSAPPPPGLLSCPFPHAPPSPPPPSCQLTGLVTFPVFWVGGVLGSGLFMLSTDLFLLPPVLLLSGDVLPTAHVLLMYRSHIANIMPTYCSLIAHMSITYCPYIIYVLVIYCSHIAHV